MRERSGFTLIELIVVMAVIGILAGIVFATLGDARQRGRDGRRVADLKRIQVALSIYYDGNDRYPTSIGSGASSVLVTGGQIETVPTDPSNGAAYSYAAYVSSVGNSTSLCSSYHLGADLERTTHVALQADADAYVGASPSPGETLVPQGALCTGSSPDFHGSDQVPCNASDVGTACYDIRP